MKCHNIISLTQQSISISTPTLSDTFFAYFIDIWLCFFSEYPHTAPFHRLLCHILFTFSLWKTSTISLDSIFKRLASEYNITASISAAHTYMYMCVCVSNVSQQLCACKYPIHYNLLNHNMTFQCIVTNSIALQRSRMHFGIDLICTRQKVRTTHTHTHIYMHTNRFQCLLLWASN